MKLTNVILNSVKCVERLGRSMGDLVRRILLLAFVSLALILTAPVIHASELNENQAILTQYMHTFQIDDWHIQLVLVNKNFLNNVLQNTSSVGASQLNFNTKYGVIWVLRRNEYTPEMFKSLHMHDQTPEWIIVDQQNTVVHELIHMVWEHCHNEEICVAMLAEAVVPHEDTK